MLLRTREQIHFLLPVIFHTALQLRWNNSEVNTLEKAHSCGNRKKETRGASEVTALLPKEQEILVSGGKRVSNSRALSLGSRHARVPSGRLLQSVGMMINSPAVKRVNGYGAY